MSAHCDKCGSHITYLPGTWPLGSCELCDVRAERDAAEDRIERLGSLAMDLLGALQPWELHGAAVRSAAARLTVAFAAVPLPPIRAGGDG